MDADMKAEARELRKVQTAAKNLWLEVRLRARRAASAPEDVARLAHFTDPAALKTLRIAVSRAWPCSWLDLEDSIREHAVLPFTQSPWYLDTWIAQARSLREALVVAPLTVQEAGIRASKVVLGIPSLEEQERALGLRA